MIGVLSVFSAIADVKPLPAKLQKVTVYLQGAHLHYSENVSLTSGITEVTFENISPYIQAQSLQASSSAGLVMDIRHNIKYREKPAVSNKYQKEIQQVLDSLEDLYYIIKENENSVQTLEKEKSVLLSNRLMSGSSQHDSLPLLRQSLDFLRERLNNILKEELKLEKQRKAHDKLKTALTTRYNNLILLQNGEDPGNREVAQPVHQVILSLYSETPATAKVSFHYLVQTASWVPHYEMMTSSSEKKMDLNYFAYVSQNSGLDWKGVPLTLSTSNPGEGHTKPDLSPWYLSYVQYREKMLKQMDNSKMPLRQETLDYEGEKPAQSGATYDIDDYVMVHENLIRVEYEIKVKYDITSDAKQHKVLINKKDVPISLIFSAVPKLTNDAFLMAAVSGWEEMNLIPGAARLYFDGSYVGETFLNAETTSDTMHLNLGRDKQISMTRKKIKEKHDTKFIGDQKVETRTIELVVRNTKSLDIEMILEDQIPVVMGAQDIKVTLVSSDGAELEQHTGKLTWKLKLKPKESKKLVFTYEVRYPQDKTVYGL